MSRLRVGINGFGRIGRILFRAGIDNENIEFVGINNVADNKQTAHLLKYDSTHGRFPKAVSFDQDHLIVENKKIPVSHTKNPADIPWKQWEVDVVFECTGAFKEKQDFLKHIEAGAKKVIVSAPAPGADLTVVYGINHKQYDAENHKVVSNASCTTNCLAPVAKVLDEVFGIEKGLMTTIHSYTSDQKLLDGEHKDLRRARSAAVSMIPTTTGAAKAVGLVLPNLAGKIDGMAIRVPTFDASIVDFVFNSKKIVTTEAINQALIEAADGELKGILGYESDPLVSVDYIGNTNSSTVDLDNTMVIEGHLAKVFAWYDNEMGFSHRMIDLALYIAGKGL